LQAGIEAGADAVVAHLILPPALTTATPPGKGEALGIIETVTVATCIVAADAVGHYWIAVDAVQAGVGDIVMVIDKGNSARQVVDMGPAPIRAVAVDIVDEIDLRGSY